MKAVRIDPRSKKITDVEYDGTIEDLIFQHFPQKYKPRDLCTKEINIFHDFLLFVKEGESMGLGDSEGRWGHECLACQELHTFAGVAIIFGSKGNSYQMRDVSVPADVYRTVLGFVVDKGTLSGWLSYQWHQLKRWFLNA